MSISTVETDQPTKAVKILFWVGCAIFFSKITWYGFGAYYLDSGERREFMTYLFGGWIIAQFMLFLVALPWLIKEINAPSIFWTVAVVPYFILGLVYGRFGFFYLQDVARYALPVGWMLFFSVAVRRLSAKEILYALIGAIGLCMAVRLAIHLLHDADRVRYGRHYELFLISLLLILPVAIQRKYLIPLLILTAGIVLSMLFGNTRVILLGLAGMSVLAIAAAVLDRRFDSPQRCTTIVSACIVIALSGLTLSGHMPGSHKRVDISSALTVTSGSKVEPPKAVQNSPARDMATSELAPEETRADELERAHKNWASALRNANLGLGDRIAEAAYYIEAMRQNAISFWLGAGAGDSVSVTIREDDVRQVRGAHNTFVTLLHRHGAVLGTLLILFAGFYGLPTNVRQLVQTDSPEWRVILTALISYRIIIIGLSQLHQGLFDDPVIYLAIAVSLNPAIPITRNLPVQEPLPASR